MEQLFVLIRNDRTLLETYVPVVAYENIENLRAKFGEKFPLWREYSRVNDRFYRVVCDSGKVVYEPVPLVTQG